MPRPARKPNRKNKHVRIHEWEMDTDAWRSLSTDARALLVEFRYLYNGEDYPNRVFFSTRQMMERLNIGQRRAEKARDELLDRGWIRVIEKGAFKLKVRHATVYALTHDPINKGEIAPRDYMRFSTVAEMTTAGSRGSYRGQPETPRKRPDGSRGEYRDDPFS